VHKSLEIKQYLVKAKRGARAPLAPAVGARAVSGARPVRCFRLPERSGE